jgi:branched-chain amino acid transport system permease protein
MTGFSSFSVFLQIFINGILFGSMYGVAAIGLSLIFGSMEIVFIAQGAVMILAAYFAYWMFTLGSLDPFFCLVLSLPLFMFLGWVFYRGLFHKVAAAGKNPSLLLAFGLMVLLQNFMSFVWTPDTRAINTTYTALGIAIGSIHISFTRLMVFFISIAATGLVFVFMKRTFWGKAVRAASEDMRAAALLGISPRRVSSLTFAIGIALAGVAGVATATTYPFDPYSGFLFSLKALIAVAFGGLGSVGGALLGGILLGVLESMGSYVFGGGWADAISYIAFLLVIMLRPEGLFGKPVRAA